MRYQLFCLHSCTSGACTGQACVLPTLLKHLFLLRNLDIKHGPVSGYYLKQNFLYSHNVSFPINVFSTVMMVIITTDAGTKIFTIVLFLFISLQEINGHLSFLWRLKFLMLQFSKLILIQDLSKYFYYII